MTQVLVIVYVDTNGVAYPDYQDADHAPFDWPSTDCACPMCDADNWNTEHRGFCQCKECGYTERVPDMVLAEIERLETENMEILRELSNYHVLRISHYKSFS